MSRMADLHHELTTTTTTRQLVPADAPENRAGCIRVTEAEAYRIVRGDVPSPDLAVQLARIGLALQAGCTVTITTTPPGAASTDDDWTETGNVTTPTGSGSAAEEVPHCDDQGCSAYGKSDLGSTLACTRGAGHDGPHVACGLSVHHYAVWR